MIGHDPFAGVGAKNESRLRRQRRRIKGQCWRWKRFTGWFDPHAGRQRRGRATGIVVVVVVALLFDGDLPVALGKRDQQASGGRTPFARTDPWRHQQPQHNKDHQQRAQVKHNNITPNTDTVSVGPADEEVNAFHLLGSVWLIASRSD